MFLLTPRNVSEYNRFRQHSCQNPKPTINQYFRNKPSTVKALWCGITSGGTYRNYGFYRDRVTLPSLTICQSLSGSGYSQVLTGHEGASPLSRQAEGGSRKQPVTHSAYRVVENFKLYQISCRIIVHGRILRLEW
jgi:hypothetical protein